MPRKLLEDGSESLHDDGSFRMLDELTPALLRVVKRFARLFEHSTDYYVAQFEYSVDDADNVPVGRDTIDAITLTVFERSTRAIIRDAENAFNDNDVAISVDGQLQWSVQVQDSAIQLSTTAHDRAERKRAIFEWCFESHDALSLTNFVDTTSGSSTVTINATAHGLTAGEHVFIGPSVADVGGLRLAGSWQIDSVATDSFTITHPCEADATVSGGGGSAVDVFVNPRVKKAVFDFEVIRVEVHECPNS